MAAPIPPNLAASSAPKAPLQNEGQAQAQPIFRHPTLLEALQAFKQAQERRVAHWAEYEEAMKAFFEPSAGQKSDADADEEEESGASTIRRRRGPINGSQNLEESTEGSASNDQHTHYDAQLRTLDEGVMSQILRLVTTGLLECSHEVRAIQIELAAPRSADATSPLGAMDDGAEVRSTPSITGTAAGEGEMSLKSPQPRPAELIRPDLAAIIGSVQDLENALLRQIVQRDQARRLERIESDSVTNTSEDIAQAQREIARIKGEITEKMQEINAEMAELVM